MFDYVPVKHKYYFVFPDGALRTNQDVMKVMDQAADTGEKVILYAVHQSGYIEEFPVTHETIIEYPGKPYLGCKLLNPGGGHRNTMFLGDAGVGGDGVHPLHESHRTFLVREDAEKYSRWMKSDPTYIASVKAWHAHCNKMDRLFGF